MYVPRSWSPSLLTIDRIECDRAHLVGELVEPLGELDALDGRGDRLGPAGDLRAGMRVERFELARPAAQPEQDDRLRRLARLLGLLGQQLADRRQPGEPGQLEEAAAVESEREAALMTRPSMVPGEFRRVQQGPEQVGQPVFAAVARWPSSSRPAKCDSSSGVGRRVRTARKAVSTAVRSSGARSAIWPAAREQAVLDFLADDLAVHEHQALGNRAAAGVEFVFAGVAVAADEIVAAGVVVSPDEPVRLRAQGRDRGGLEERAGDLLGPQARHRERRPRRLPAPRGRSRWSRCRAGRPRSRR